MMINLIRRTIARRYHLKCEQNRWEIREKTRSIRLLASGGQSFGFSLDDPDPENSPLAFFGGSPPKYITKICDGMVAVLHRGQLYLFSVEVKTADRSGAKKQLLNGRLFWRWLMNLYEAHDHLPESLTVSHISLLAWRPRRKTPRKGGTSHSNNENLEKLPKADDGFDACFEARNLANIPLADIISQC